MRGGQKVEHRIGRAAHSNIDRHGVLEAFEAGDCARQNAFIILLIIGAGHIYDGAACAQEKLLAV